MTLRSQMDDVAGEETRARGVQGARFRRVLGHYATGVTVITACRDGMPRGLAVNSFTSVSLDPPLVSFCVARGSTTWPHIRAAGHFCVNFLHEDQGELLRQFAISGGDKFAGVAWKAGPTGAPVIENVLGWLDCAVVAEHHAGDHVIVLGQVHDLDATEDGRPLIFYRGAFGRFEV